VSRSPSSARRATNIALRTARSPSAASISSSSGSRSGSFISPHSRALRFRIVARSSHRAGRPSGLTRDRRPTAGQAGESTDHTVAVASQLAPISGRADRSAQGNLQRKGGCPPSDGQSGRYAARMERVDLLGRRQVAILDAVHRGAMRSRACAGQVRALVDEPSGDALLHDTLRRFEEAGLLRSSRQTAGRSYSLTAAGRSRLRAQRRFERALLGLLARSDRAQRPQREDLSGSVRQATADHAH
jgi:hypothetical protein